VKQQPTQQHRSKKIVGVLAVVALVASLAAPIAAAAPGSVVVHASCAGDVVSGTAKVAQGAHGGELDLSLMSKPLPSSRFATTGKSLRVDAYGGHSYTFSFDVGRLHASAYRVDPPGAHGNVVPAASCAPGHQVPEAPMSLLLPLSVIGLVGLTAARRRRFGKR
jgi:hypothetical protein